MALGFMSNFIKRNERGRGKRSLAKMADVTTQDPSDRSHCKKFGTVVIDSLYSTTLCIHETHFILKNPLGLRLKNIKNILGFESSYKLSVEVCSSANSVQLASDQQANGLSQRRKLGQIILVNSEFQWTLFVKWANSSGHFQRKNFRGHFSRILGDIFCPQEFFCLGEFSWSFLG